MRFELCAGLHLFVLVRQGVSQPVLYGHQEHALHARGEEDEGADGGLVRGEGRLHRHLQRQREHADGEEAKEPRRDEDVGADIGEEEEVGHDDDADDVAEAAQLRDLHDLPRLLGQHPQPDRADGAHDDHDGAG